MNSKRIFKILDRSLVVVLVLVSIATIVAHFVHILHVWIYREVQIDEFDVFLVYFGLVALYRSPNHQNGKE